MKRLLLILLLLVAHSVHAACVDTPNLGLQKCDFGDSNWNVFTNANWDKLDYSCSAPLTCAAGDPIALGTVGAANGGTGQTTYAKGDILVGTSGGAVSKLAVGANGLVLMADSGETLGVKYGAVLGTSLPVVDSLTLLKNSADGTKRAKFDLSGITTGTTRTITVPNVSSTMATRTGSITTDHCAKFDSNKNLVDAGDECGTGGGGGGGTEYSGGTGSSTLDNSDDSYFPISGLGYATGFGTSENVYLNVDKAGTFSNLACRASDTDISGSGSNGHTLTLVSGGPTAVKCDVDGANQTCHGTGLTEHVSGGHLTSYIKSEIKGSPTTNVKVSCTFTFTPD